MSKHGMKSGRNHNIRYKEEKADPILVVTFQQQVTIYSTGFQLTQSDGKAIMHVFITASLYSFPVLEQDNFISSLHCYK
jgi:hypothetical protein